MSLPGLELPTLSFAPPLETPDPTVLTVDLDHLITSRLLIQGSSGSGKSWAIRSLLEQTHGRVQQLVLDKEGEFSSLRERYDYILAGQRKEDDVPATPRTARLLCRQLMDLGASAVLDLSELPEAGQRGFVRLFLEELMASPKEQWRPLLVVLDEAQFFVPEGASVESSEAVASLCTLGRKRGYAPVLATQRLSKLNKNAAAEMRNKLIGLTSLGLDVKRAADDLGFGREQAARLMELEPGQFFAVGPAIAKKVVLARTGDVLTTHPRAGQIAAYTPPPPAEAVRALLEQLRGLAEGAEEADRAEKETADRTETLERQVASLQAQLAAAQDGGGTKTVERVVEKEKIVEKRVEVPAVTEAQIAALADKADAFRATAKDAMNVTLELVAASDEILRELRRVQGSRPGATPVVSEASVPEASAPGGPVSEPALPPVPNPVPNEDARETRQETPGLTRPQQAILDTLADLAALGLSAPARVHVAVLAGVSPTSSGYTNNLSTLRTLGLVEYPSAGCAALTGAGREVARPTSAPVTRQGLQAAWLARLTGPQRRILETLIACYPTAMTRAVLAGWVEASPTSSGFSNNLSSLRTLGLVEYPDKGTVAATGLLFPEGLT